MKQQHCTYREMCMNILEKEKNESCFILKNLKNNLNKKQKIKNWYINKNRKPIKKNK